MIHIFMLRDNRASNRVIVSSLFALCVSFPTFFNPVENMGRPRSSAGAPLSIYAVVCAAARLLWQFYCSVMARGPHPSLPMHACVILDGQGRAGRSRRRRRP